MFLQAQVLNVGGDFVSNFFSGAVLVFIGLILVGAIIGVAFYIRFRRSFDINVEIRSERAGGGYNIFYDKAAVLKDRDTKQKYLKLLKQKGVELPIPEYNVFIQTNRGDLIKYLKKSEEIYLPLKPGDVSQAIIKGRDDKFYEVGIETLKVIDSDLLHWLVKRKGQHRKLFDPETLMMKILPYIPHIIGVVGVIFIMYLLLDSLPTILSELKELTIELRSLKGAAITE